MHPQQSAPVLSLRKAGVVRTHASLTLVGPRELGPQLALLNLTCRRLGHCRGCENALWALEGAEMVAQLGEQFVLIKRMPLLDDDHRGDRLAPTFMRQADDGGFLNRGIG